VHEVDCQNVTQRILEGIPAGEPAVSDKKTLSEKGARQYMKKC